MHKIASLANWLLNWGIIVNEENSIIDGNTEKKVQWTVVLWMLFDEGGQQRMARLPEMTKRL